MEPFLSYLLTSLRNFRKVRALAAFTLVELLVSLSIITVIFSIILLGQGNFNRSVVLTDTAYTIAMAIRQMESYGVSSLNFTGGGAGPISNAGYGVYFSMGRPTTYYEIADINGTASGNTAGLNPSWCPALNPANANTPEAKPGNCLYDNINEQLAAFTIGGGYTITDLCGTTPTGIKCASDGSGTQDASIHIVFLRPNTQSIITGYSAGVLYHLSNACIKLSSPDRTAFRMIKVTNLGQVSVTSDPTCT